MGSIDADFGPDSTSFLVDVMCGRLVTYLRMCGYDAAYALDRDATDDEQVLAWADREARTILTRDRDLASRAPDSVLLTARSVTEQLATVREAGYPLALPEEPQRCSRCNGRLVAVAADEPSPAYAPGSDERPVWRCVVCDQHFWRGSHWDDVGETVATLE